MRSSRYCLEKQNILSQREVISTKGRASKTFPEEEEAESCIEDNTQPMYSVCGRHYVVTILICKGPRNKKETLNITICLTITKQKVFTEGH